MLFRLILLTSFLHTEDRDPPSNLIGIWQISSTVSATGFLSLLRLARILGVGGLNSRKVCSHAQVMLLILIRVATVQQARWSLIVSKHLNVFKRPKVHEAFHLLPQMGLITMESKTMKQQPLLLPNYLYAYGT